MSSAKSGPFGQDRRLQSPVEGGPGRHCPGSAIAAVPVGGALATNGGVFAGSYAVASGVAAVLPVDLVIPGCPPSPAALMKGLLALMGQ